MKSSKQQLENNVFTAENQVVLPINVATMIPADAKVRLLNEVLEELSYTGLYAQYSRKGRNLAADPKRMFKIICYAYMNGIYPSRAIAQACKRDIHFMWLLGGANPPSYQTLARFRAERLNGVLEELFYQLVRKLYAKGEVQFQELFVDGTKIEANANKYSFVWKKSEEKYALRLDEKLREFCECAIREYDLAAQSPATLLALLESKAAEEGVEFVHGKGQRKHQLQRDIETLARYLERQARYAAHKEVFRGRNSFSKTDMDATFMHMKEDHTPQGAFSCPWAIHLVRNSQLKPGYNLQLGVEGGYIVGMDISSERSDMRTLIPLLKRMKQNLGVRHASVTTDAGYESEENYAYLEANKQLCFIKPSNYKRMKKRKYKNDMHLRENMAYDKERDEYTCACGKTLRAVGLSKRKSAGGYESELTVYECESCAGCPQKEMCTKSKGNRQMRISREFLRYREQSLQNIQSEQGVNLRINRSIQSEGTFGVLKEDYGFRRFMMRSEEKVRIETLLYCMAFNLNKLYNKTKNNRFGYLFYEKLIS